MWWDILLTMAAICPKVFCVHYCVNTVRITCFEHFRWNSDRFTVVVGAHDLTTVTPVQVTVGVAEVTVHELFHWLDSTAIPVNDIALLRVSLPSH